MAKKFSGEGSVIIEEYVKGKEFVVEGLAVNNKFQNLTCGEYNHFNLPDVFSSALTIFPANVDESIIKKIECLNEQIITGFGLNNGRTHSEFIVDDDGEVYLIETAARGGGTFYFSDIVPLITGINSEEILMKIATNRITNLPKIEKATLFVVISHFIYQ